MSLIAHVAICFGFGSLVYRSRELLTDFRTAGFCLYADNIFVVTNITIANEFDVAIQLLILSVALLLQKFISHMFTCILIFIL